MRCTFILAIVRHYVRVPFTIRAVNGSRLCCLTNVSVVSEIFGTSTWTKEQGEEVAVKGRNYCDYY